MKIPKHPDDYQRIETPQQSAVNPAPALTVPGYNPFLRCPLPLVVAYPDNLRQYYRDGVPQTRMFIPTL